MKRLIFTGHIYKALFYRLINAQKYVLKTVQLHVTSKGGKYIVNTIPKAGSHLIIKLMERLGVQRHGGGIARLYGGSISDAAIKRRLFFIPPGCFMSCHLFYNYELRKFIEIRGGKMVLLVRDPRDVVQSLASYIREKEHPYSRYFGKLTMDETINLCITGLDKPFCELNRDHNMQGGISETYARFLRWEDQGLAKRFCFEDLVGARGGGDNEKQFNSVRALVAFLGINVGQNKLQEIAANLFGGTSTFRSGQIGKWRGVLTEEQKALFKRHTGDLLIKLGYEKDTNW